MLFQNEFKKKEKIDINLNHKKKNKNAKKIKIDKQLSILSSLFKENESFNSQTLFFIRNKSV